MVINYTIINFTVFARDGGVDLKDFLEDFLGGKGYQNRIK